MKPLTCARTVCVLVFLAGCSSSSPTATESISKLNESCAKVRELNEQVQALNLDEKGQAALDDPKAKELLDEAAKATEELQTQLDAKAKADDGKLGELRRKYEDNKETIGDVADFAATESKDTLKDKARQLKKVADIIGADNCAGTETPVG
jgi:outer membrane murein-binding lipoprotein Lpp